MHTLRALLATLLLTTACAEASPLHPQNYPHIALFQTPSLASLLEQGVPPARDQGSVKSDLLWQEEAALPHAAAVDEGFVLSLRDLPNGYLYALRSGSPKKQPALLADWHWLRPTRGEITAGALTRTTPAFPAPKLYLMLAGFLAFAIALRQRARVQA